MFRRRVAIAAMMCVLLALGCKRTVTTGATGSMGSGSISRNGTTAWFVISQGTVPVVVWADMSGSSSGSSDVNGVRGTIRRPDGKSIALDYRAADGTLTIDGARHDLANGSVFLLYCGESPARVVQLRHGPLQTNDPVKAVTDLGRDDAEVHAFTERQKPTTQAG
jgi:hypothetical protein